MGYVLYTHYLDTGELSRFSEKSNNYQGFISVYINMPAKKLNTIDLMGNTINIVYKDLEDGDWGQCNIDERTITLHNKCLKNKKDHWATLIHEVTHMVFELSGIAYMERNDEEAYVRCVENLLIPWVLKNQDLGQ